MYGTARGVRPPREGIYGDPIGTNYDKDNGPPLSGINAPGNSLTMEGPTKEPVGTNDLEKRRLKMAMAMMGRGMQGYAQGMQQNSIPNVMPQQSPFDLYGNPIGG